MSKPLASATFGQKSNSTLKLNQGGSDWTEGKQDLASNHGDSDSDLSEAEVFIAKGAFLLTPSYELSIEKASSICEKMNFKSSFSLTKTATGILFKFENPEDYQAVFKKGFHKVTGARFYKKIPIPCRPQKTFTIFVYEIPDEIPEEDIRHALYKFHSVVELTRLPHSNLDLNKPAPVAASKIDSENGGFDKHIEDVARRAIISMKRTWSIGERLLAGHLKQRSFMFDSLGCLFFLGVSDPKTDLGESKAEPTGKPTFNIDLSVYPPTGVSTPKVEKAVTSGQNPLEASTVTVSPPSVVRITLASLEEANYLLENGLDFYGATFFPTDTLTPTAIGKEEVKKTNRFRRSIDYTFLGSRVQDLLPVFDATGFQKIPPPTMKTFKPLGSREREFGKK